MHLNPNDLTGMFQTHKSNSCLMKLKIVETWKRVHSLIGDGDLNLHPRFNGDGGNLLHYMSRAEKVDNPLVNTEFKSVTRVGTFTTWRFSGCDVKNFSGHSHRSLHPQPLKIVSIYPHKRVSSYNNTCTHIILHFPEINRTSILVLI